MNRLIISCTGLILLAVSGCGELLDFNEPGNLVPETVAEDPLLPQIEINGTKLHTEAFGDISNPIIIFLHGGPGSDYRALISQIGEENASRYPDKRTIRNGGLSRLQDDYYCVFYDQRGAGLSPRFGKDKVSFALYLDDLDAIVDHFLQKKKNETGVTETQVYLVAWSYGGTLATGYINQYPSKVKNVAMYEPGPFSKKAYDYFYKHTTSYVEQVGKNWLEEFLLSHDHFTPDDHEKADYQMLLGAFRSNPQFHENPDTPLWRMGALVTDEDLEEEGRDNTSNLSAFQGSILFIAGEFTHREYPDYAGIQMAYYTHHYYAEIPGTGHTGPWEKSGEVAGLIRSFFDNH